MVILPFLAVSSFLAPHTINFPNVEWRGWRQNSRFSILPFSISNCFASTNFSPRKCLIEFHLLLSIVWSNLCLFTWFYIYFLCSSCVYILAQFIKHSARIEAFCIQIVPLIRVASIRKRLLICLSLTWVLHQSFNVSPHVSFKNLNLNPSHLSRVIVS